MATGDQFLNAVSFYTKALDSDYEIYIRTGVNADQPVSGTVVGIKTGTIAMPGYHTIVLDSSVALSISASPNSAKFCPVPLLCVEL